MKHFHYQKKTWLKQRKKQQLFLSVTALKFQLNSQKFFETLGSVMRLGWEERSQPGSCRKMLVFPTSNYCALLHSDHVCRLENAPQLTAIPGSAHEPEEPFRWRRGLRSTATSRQPTKDSHQSRLRVKAFKEARPLLQTPTQSCVNVRPQKR